jgi:hypothetical protein
MRPAATLQQVATLAMSFMQPIEMVDPEVRPGIERAPKGAQTGPRSSFGVIVSWAPGVPRNTIEGVRDSLALAIPLRWQDAGLH